VNAPTPPMPKLNKYTALIAMAAIVMMAASYAIFLAATWHQYQEDRQRRDKKIDELLSRLPKKDVPDAESAT
jgi:cell division protein FtsL